MLLGLFLFPSFANIVSVPALSSEVLSDFTRTHNRVWLTGLNWGHSQ